MHDLTGAGSVAGLSHAACPDRSTLELTVLQRGPIADLERLLGDDHVRARVDEVDVPFVATGQKGRVYLQSAPNTPVPARVVRVASKGSRTVGRDVVTFETLLEVLSDDERISPDEADQIRAYWERLKSTAEAFVVACERGQFGPAIAPT